MVRRGKARRLGIVGGTNSLALTCLLRVCPLQDLANPGESGLRG